MPKEGYTVVLLPPEVGGSGHRLRAATVLPVLEKRRTSHLVIWEAAEEDQPAETQPAQRVFVCAYEPASGSPFMTAEISPGIEAAELAFPHDGGAFAFRLEKGSREWSVRRLALKNTKTRVCTRENTRA